MKNSITSRESLKTLGIINSREHKSIRDMLKSIYFSFILPFS